MSSAVLIAGGGTGGHLFPGLAVAGELRRLRPDIPVTFVSAGKALESEVLKRAGLPLEPLKASAFRGRGVMGRLKALAQVPPAVWRAMGLIKRHNPGLVLAVGGYAALPLGLAAWLKGVPLAVQEQNASPGLTNRVLSKFAKVVFTSFPGAENELPAAKCVLMGNPVRADLLEKAGAVQRPEPVEEFRVLILGGSQGAQSINKGVTGALELLGEHKDKLRFVHQTGQSDEQWVAEAYEKAGFQAEVKAFFQDVGKLYGWAHLIICRAGAGTLTEVMATGRACVAVPYPYAAGDHQMLNAKAMAAQNAARLVADADFDAGAAAEAIKSFAGDQTALHDMEQKALALAKTEAATAIAMRCLELMKEGADV